MPCEQKRILRRERQKPNNAGRKSGPLREQEAKEAKARVEASRAAIRNEAKKLGWRLVEEKSNQFVARKPYSDDKIYLQVLAGGIIKTITDKISMVNHSNAEAFLRNIATTLKSTWKIFHRATGDHVHAHGHAHEHIH